MEVGAHTVLDELSPIMSEVNAAEAGYHRIQSASEIFASCRDIGQDQAFDGMSELRSGFDFRV